MLLPGNKECNYGLALAADGAGTTKGGCGGQAPKTDEFFDRNASGKKKGEFKGSCRNCVAVWSKKYVPKPPGERAHIIAGAKKLVGVTAGPAAGAAAGAEAAAGTGAGAGAGAKAKAAGGPSASASASAPAVSLAAEAAAMAAAAGLQAVGVTSTVTSTGTSTAEVPLGGASTMSMVAVPMMPPLAAAASPVASTVATIPMNPEVEAAMVAATGMVNAHHEAEAVAVAAVAAATAAAAAEAGTPVAMALPVEQSRKRPLGDGGVAEDEGGRTKEARRDDDGAFNTKSLHEAAQAARVGGVVGGVAGGVAGGAPGTGDAGGGAGARPVVPI